MLIAFLILLRESVEAALIVGIIAGYLRQTGRTAWMPLVWIGVASAVLLSLAAGIMLDLLGSEFPQREQELFEALVGLVAVAILTSMVFWMRKRNMRGELQGRIDAAIAPGPARGGGIALIGMVFFAVAREGLETVFFLMAIVQQSMSWWVPAGALLGLIAGSSVGFAIYWGGIRFSLSRFFHWTGVFILVVAAGLLSSSLRALHEAGLWNGLQAVPLDLSDVLPVDGVAGAVLAGLFGYSDRPSLGEITTYLLFLLITLPLFLAGGSLPRTNTSPLRSRSGA